MYPEKFKKDDLIFDKLSEETDLSDFCCDYEDELGVDDFIHKEAWSYQIGNFGMTYLFYYEDNIVGFVTIAMGNIDAKKEAPDREEIGDTIAIKHYPSVLIGQLGVHNDCRRKDLGRIICDWVAGRAAKLQEIIGCRYVSLATMPNLVGFYERCDFETMKPDRKTVIMVRKV